MSQIHALQTTLLPLLIVNMLNSRFFIINWWGHLLFQPSILKNSSRIPQEFLKNSSRIPQWFCYGWQDKLMIISRRKVMKISIRCCGILVEFWWEKQMASPNVNNDALCTKLLDLTLPFQLQYYYCIYLDIIRTLDYLKLFFSSSTPFCQKYM